MNFKTERKYLILIALMAIGLYANSLLGDFVYDDRRQIVGNALIQNSNLYSKALTLDVWAFKSNGTVPTSNYWRPVFTGWCILLFRIFVLEPFGWHLANILLHAGICLLAFLLLRRWGLAEMIAFGIVLIFAVHPVHTESVAWISGSPDLLFGIFLLASFWFAENAAETREKRSLNLAVALIFYLLALGSKEVALLCFPIFHLIFARRRTNESTVDKDRSLPTNMAIKLTSIFAAAAAGFFLVRWSILGRISMPAERSATGFQAIMSIPEIFAFYLRQLVFPFWLGPNYSLRPVDSVGLFDFVIPTIIGLTSLACIWFLAKRSWIQRMGSALFILPLLPVFNLSAFQPEQIVHDRYLYIPLLGFLMMVIPFVWGYLQRRFNERAGKLFFGFVALIAAPLAIQTVVYNQVWWNDLSLWQHAVKIDADSSFNWSQLGSALSERDLDEVAIEAYSRSIEIKPRPLAYIGRSRSLIKTASYDDAIEDLQPIVNSNESDTDLYTLYQAYEALAVALQGKPDLVEADKILREARTKLPFYRASLTEKLAVILYNQNRKQDALRELEGVKAEAKGDLLPASKAVFLRLGMLYAEIGNKAAAKENLTIFLNETSSTKDKLTDEDRKQAAELLRRL